MLKRVFKYGLISLIAFFSLTGIAMTYVYFNQDEIKDLALDKINESINGSLIVEGTEASLLSSFPSVSINLENPHLISVADTLLACKELQMKLNLLDFIKKEYRVNELEISEGLIDLKTLKNGDINFEIWKSDTSKLAEEMSFAIESIVFSDVHINYEDIQAKNQYNTHIDDVLAQVELVNENWNIDLEGSLFSFKYIEDTNSRIVQKEIELNALFSYLQNEEKLDFQKILFSNSATDLEAKGFLSLIDEKENLALNINSSSSAQGLKDIFESYIKLPENYSYHANTEIETDLIYAYGKDKNLEIQCQIELSDGELTELSSNESLENIKFKGEYKLQNETSNVTIDQFTSDMAHGAFALNGQVKKIPDPEVNLNIQGELNLKELSNFLALDSVLFNGEINFNNVLAANFKSEDFENEQWIEKIEIGGEASLDDGSIEWLEDEILLSSLNGQMTFSEEHIAVQDLNGDVGSSSFNLNGTITNLLKYSFKEDEVLAIEAYLESDVIKLEEFLKESQENEYDSELSFPENIEFKLNSNISNLTFNKFEAKKIKGLIEYKDKRFDANDISFKTCEGSLEGRISIIQKGPDNFLVTSQSSSKSLNIKEVFREFANFDQDFLTDEHISGITDTDLFFQGNMDQYLVFKKNSIQTVADISLKNGELIEHPAMIEISEYLRKKRLLHPFLKIDEFEENVKHLSFSALKNRIEIKNSKITIPQMEIKSNAMDCNIRGVHGFDNNIDYRLDFRMREMLKQHEEEIEGIIVEDDGTGSRIFIAMKGNVDDPDVSFDKESARAKRKNDIKKAKEDFLDIFRKKPKGEEEEEIEIEVKDQAIVEKKKKKGLKSLFEKEKDLEEEEALDFEIIDN